jgi:hypothetical protein
LDLKTKTKTKKTSSPPPPPSPPSSSSYPSTKTADTNGNHQKNGAPDFAVPYYEESPFDAQDPRRLQHPGATRYRLDLRLYVKPDLLALCAGDRDPAAYLLTFTPDTPANRAAFSSLSSSSSFTNNDLNGGEQEHEREEHDAAAASSAALPQFCYALVYKDPARLSDASPERTCYFATPNPIIKTYRTWAQQQHHHQQQQQQQQEKDDDAEARKEGGSSSKGGGSKGGGSKAKTTPTGNAYHYLQYRDAPGNLRPLQHLFFPSQGKGARRVLDTSRLFSVASPPPAPPSETFPPVNAAPTNGPAFQNQNQHGGGGAFEKNQNQNFPTENLQNENQNLPPPPHLYPTDDAAAFLDLSFPLTTTIAQDTSALSADPSSPFYFSYNYNYSPSHQQ